MNRRSILSLFGIGSVAAVAVAPTAVEATAVGRVEKVLDRGRVADLSKFWLGPCDCGRANPIKRDFQTAYPDVLYSITEVQSDGAFGPTLRYRLTRDQFRVLEEWAIRARDKNAAKQMDGAAS